MRGSSLGERPPPSSPVVPSSPVPESSSIGLRRGFSDEDLRELVQLLRHAPLLLDHLGERNHLDVAVAPDRDHAAFALDDQLDRGDPESRGPDPVDRRWRPAALKVTEHGDPRLEAGVTLDGAGEDVADSSLRQPDVTERILLRLAPKLSLLLRDARPLGDHDDAEELALSAPAVEVRDDLGEGTLELGDDEEVGAAGHTTHHRYPAGVAAHDPDHPYPMLPGRRRGQAAES